MTSNYQNSFKVCIAAMIKDEQRYIKEWIDYHLNLGICKFILYEDWNSSSHKDVLDPYIKDNKVILLNIPDCFNDIECHRLEEKEFRQRIVFDNFIRVYKDQFDYLAFIDVDEFFDTNKHNLFKVLKENPNFTLYCTNWIIMLSDQIQDKWFGRSYSVVEAYPRSMDFGPCRFGEQKLIINLHKVDNFNFVGCPHEGIWLEPEDDFKYYLNFKLRHYLTKSWDEWCWRLISKGEQSTADYNRKFEEFFDVNPHLVYMRDILMKQVKDKFVKSNDFK